MPVQGDSTISRTDAVFSASMLDTVQLLRNMIDRVDLSGVQVDAIMELLTQIQVNTNMPRAQLQTKVVDTTGAVTAPGTLLIECPIDCRISVFDVYVTLDGASDVKFTDGDDGNDIMGPFFAPNDGQGFVRNYPHGLFLPKSKSLYYTNVGAVDHGIEINFAIVE